MAEEQIEKSKLEDRLDRLFKSANFDRYELEGPCNLMLLGRSGFPELTMIRRWARQKDINLTEIDCAAIDLQFVRERVWSPDCAAMPVLPPLKGSRFTDAISLPRSVLLFTNFLRGNARVREFFRSLLKDRMADDGSGGSKQMPNFLFGIVLVDPQELEENRDALDLSLAGVFCRMKVEPDPKEQLMYLRAIYGDELKDAKKYFGDEWVEVVKGKLALAEKILGDERFAYATPEREGQVEHVPNNMYSNLPSFAPTTPLALKRVLDASRGKKEELLRLWNNFCDYQQKGLIEDILKDYVDPQA